MESVRKYNYYSSIIHIKLIIPDYVYNIPHAYIINTYRI